jgi:hypothetical protein
MTACGTNTGNKLSGVSNNLEPGNETVNRNTEHLPEDIRKMLYKNERVILKFEWEHPNQKKKLLDWWIYETYTSFQFQKIHPSNSNLDLIIPRLQIVSINNNYTTSSDCTFVVNKGNYSELPFPKVLHSTWLTFTSDTVLSQQIIFPNLVVNTIQNFSTPDSFGIFLSDIEANTILFPMSVSIRIYDPAIPVNDRTIIKVLGIADLPWNGEITPGNFIEPGNYTSDAIFDCTNDPQVDDTGGLHNGVRVIDDLIVQ